jgi:hypothetical protein
MRVRRDAEREFQTLMTLAPRAYDDLRVEEDRIVARTYPVIIERDGDNWDLGTFQVILTLDSDDVRITKVSGEKPDGYPHPHVSTSGVPCFGNVGPPLAKLLAEGQYVAALSVLLQFLRSYNTGRHLDLSPGEGHRESRNSPFLRPPLTGDILSPRNTR